MNLSFTNLIMFGGALTGTIFLIAGVVALGRGERAAMLYLLAALLAFVLAWAPGRRLRNSLWPPDA